MQGDHVHVPFDDYRSPAVAQCTAGPVQAVKQPALVEDGGLGRVQVLRLSFAQQASCEAHDPARGVMDREDDPATEAVVAAAPLVLDDQPGLDEGVLTDLPACREPQQPIPAFRGEAETELLDRLPAQSPPQQVTEGRASELGDEVLLGQLVHPVKVAAPVAGSRTRFDFHADAVAEPYQGVEETEPFGLHDEIEDVAARLAAEAVVEAPFLVHVERRRLLVMERAQSLQAAAAGRLEHHRLAYDFSDIQQGPDSFLDIISAAHAQLR